MKGKHLSIRPARRRRSSPPEPLHALLRRLLARAGLTEACLGRTVGKPFRTVNRILCGHTELSVAMACRLAGPLHSTPEELLCAQVRHAVWVYTNARQVSDATPTTATHLNDGQVFIDGGHGRGAAPKELHAPQRGTLTPTDRAGSKSGPGGTIGRKGAAGRPPDTSSPPSKSSGRSVAPAANESASAAPRRKRSRQDAASADSGSSRAASA